VRQLEVLSNQVIYKGIPVTPIFSVTENRQRSLEAMFSEFQPFNMRVESLRYENTGPIQEQHVAMVFSIGYCKVATDRIEVSFSNWAAPQLADIAKTMDATQNVARKLQPDLKFATHNLVYYGHARVSGLTCAEYLKEFQVPVFGSGGDPLATGLSFHWREPRRGWKTSLRLDYSLAFADALFVSFEADIVGDGLKLTETGPEIQLYVGGILNELGLSLPEQGNVASEK
jgi:hypothetical protein